MDLSEQMLKEALDLYGEAQQLQADALTRFAETGDGEDKEAVTDAKKAVKKASTDKLTIEEKYKQPETVKQSHTLVLFTNHIPRVGSTDDGTWRRLLVVPSLTVFRL